LNLLATKFHRPPLPTRWIHRPQLIQQLDGGLASNRQIILVSAPAGFGKTSCIVEWVNQLDHWPVAWLSLDSTDDDPGRFFAYFIAALQQVDARLGQELEGVMRSGQLPPEEIICTTLINDILAIRSHFLVVLDDFHMIQEHTILHFVETLVANLPPQVRLILLTREDPPIPLAQLRANDRLTEIRVRDLRFTQQDAARFLNDAMGLSLTQANIAELEDKTEGWIVGLQLAGLSIRDHANPSNFIATLSGSHRFILSYLTEQVLDRQSDETQRFLLQTSIVDRLNGDLCDAITGRTDSRLLLERLFNANLFLIPLDDEGQWYRYHHLFADLLRDLQNSLHKDQTGELHRRASHWFAQAGLVNEAIQQALAAKDYSMAVDLLENHALGMMMHGYAKTVNTWVQALPVEWSSQSPRTNVAIAWMHLLRGAYREASPYLERLQVTLSSRQLREGDRPSLQAEWLVMQSFLLSMKGRMIESLAMAEEALKIAPERDSRVRSLAYLGIASTRQALNEYDLGVDAYQMAIQHSHAGENFIAEMMSISGLAQLAFEHGQLHLAFEIATPVSERVEGSSSLPPISAVVFGILGEIDYQWVQIEQARRHIERALQLSTLGGIKSGMTSCQVLLSRLSLFVGDLEAAAREIQKAIDLMQGETPDYVRQAAVSQQVRLYLARDRLASAEMALQGQGFSFRPRFSFPDLPPGQRFSHTSGLLYNCSLRVLLFQARAGRDSASLSSSGIELAHRLIDRALQNQYLIVALEALLLRAQMYAILGDRPASQADYVKALELAEPEGFIGVFVEQGPSVAENLADLAEGNQLGIVQPGSIERILAAFSKLQSPGKLSGQQASADSLARDRPVALIEPLTDRELDVLRWMAEGLKYKEIATRLFISLNTVRFHSKSIYGKLNVNNRRQAIERARQLRIL
jgi:LuxR family maltose regulon positive regulatory protein